MTSVRAADRVVAGSAVGAAEVASLLVLGFTAFAIGVWALACMAAAVKVVGLLGMIKGFLAAVGF